MAQSINDVLAKATPRESIIPVCVAGHLNAEMELLEAELQAASASGDWQPDSLASTDPRVAIAKKIQAVQKKMKAAEVVFRFRALPDEEWSDLLAEHGPRKDHAELFNPLTLPQVLIPKCCVDPVMTGPQYEQLKVSLNSSQRNQLFNTAWDANTSATSVHFSLAASAILAASTAAK